MLNIDFDNNIKSDTDKSTFMNMHNLQIKAFDPKLLISIEYKMTYQSLVF